MAWILCRMCPTELFSADFAPMGEQIVPSWTAFNIHVTSRVPEKTNIGYCPMIPCPASDMNTIYTLMEPIQKMMRTLGQLNSVLTLDQPLYAKAKIIQFHEAENFADTTIRLGGFHIACAFLEAIGRNLKKLASRIY